MIQLANDPNDGRSNWRPAAAAAKDDPLAPRRPRNAHAWPFISRHGERAGSPQDQKPTPSSDSGS
jgi:hypothetical protein